MYTRGIDLTGRIRAPNEHRGKLIRMWISTFGRKERFDARTGDVGRFYVDRLGDGKWPFESSLRLPEDALGPTLTCLGSSWKFIDIWTATDAPEWARRVAPDAVSNCTRRSELLQTFASKCSSAWLAV
jgi:hypothetical protein